VSLQSREKQKLLGKLSKFWYVTLQTLNVGTPCHTAHVNPIVHFCPDSVHHVPVYGCHSGNDALSQFLKIIWQRWYVAGGSIPKRVRKSCCTVVTELVFSHLQDTERLLLWSRHFATRSSLAAAARNIFSRQL
jgi:hypothetical protein